MKEEDLLYYFPYKIEKEHFFKNYVSEYNAFSKKHIPNYDGTNTQEFLYNKSGLTIEQIHNFEYLYENFSEWKNWYTEGRNIFSFSKELLQLLDKTDVKDIKPESFNLPYDIFYLSLKPLEWKLTKDTDSIIEGVYIDHNIWNGAGEHPEGYCDLSIYFAGNFKETFLKYIDKVKSQFPYSEIHYPGEYDSIPLGSFWNINLYFEKSEKRENVGEAIDYFLKNLKEDIFTTNKTEEEISDFDLEFYSDTLQLLTKTINLVINCLLYLSQPKDKQDIIKDLPKGLPSNFEKQLTFAKTEKDKNKIYKKIEHSGFTKINFVGQTYRKRNTETTNADSTIQPHWRRGHWRNQKTGEQLKNTKLIWIMPTIVKKENGKPIGGHIYDIEQKATNS